MRVVGQNDDDGNEVHEEGNVDAEGGNDVVVESNGGQGGNDWRKGLNGLDFDDDVFGNMDAGPSTHDGVRDSATAPQRPTIGDNVTSTPHWPNAGDNDNLDDFGRPTTLRGFDWVSLRERF